MPVGDLETIQMVDPTAISPGSDFGPRYRIEALLGQGGMGRVYKAYDKELNRTVAIKVVRQGVMGEADALNRFKQELVLASKISHKNILHSGPPQPSPELTTRPSSRPQDLRRPLRRLLEYFWTSH
jgi:serine/threonine protein kinase